MLLSTVPIFLLIADGYYQKDLKKGILLFFLCLAFVFLGTLLIKLFKLKVIYVGIPLLITVFVLAHFFNKNKNRK